MEVCHAVCPDAHDVVINMQCSAGQRAVTCLGSDDIMTCVYFAKATIKAHVCNTLSKHMIANGAPSGYVIRRCHCHAVVPPPRERVTHHGS